MYETYKWEISNKLILKNRTYSFFNEMINIEEFDSNYDSKKRQEFIHKY